MTVTRTPCRRAVVIGHGSALPERVVTNEELSRTVDTTDDWIVSRTGIRQRYIAADGELTSDLAIRAAERALARAGLTGKDVDAIILGTSTPDETFPATATKVQAAIGMTQGFAFDLQAVCSGFVYALNVATNFITAGQADRVLVIGAETFSRLLDWEDRTTCVLFGDGAGALLLEAQEGQGTNDDRGVLSNVLHSDGRHHDLLYVDGGPSSTQTTGHLRMVGREVFRHAVNNLASVVHEALEPLGLDTGDIDWIVPHQANKRILDATARKLKVSPDQVVVTVDQHANTSAASIPLALDTAATDGRLRQGQLILIEAMGGGLTWGASVVRW